MSLKNRSLRIARKLLPDTIYEEGLPKLRYRRPDVDLLPTGGALRYVMQKQGFDPIEALRINFDLVRDLAEESDIDAFLAEFRWGRRPMLAMTAADANQILNRVRQMSEDDPIYVYINRIGERGRLRLGRSIGESEVGEPGDRVSIFRFYRDRASGRKFGHAFACDIQVWTNNNGSLEVPGSGVPAVTVESRRNPIEVKPFYRPHHTYSPLEKPRLFAVNFDIDAVFMWVDGDDPAWQERQRTRRYGPDALVHPEAVSEARFRQFDELRYSLRSVERYAPWIRNIYLVTDQQRPDWLDEGGTNLTVVDHREIFPQDALPTFNSHALTASIHKLPGLSDRFILFNDDIFLGRPIGPGRFFKSNGEARFFMSKSRIEDGPESTLKSARAHTLDLIEDATGVRPVNLMKHTPVAFNRSLLEELSHEFSEDWAQTIHNPFRSANDVVPSLMHHYIGYDRRMCTPGDISYGYFGFGTDLAFDAIEKYRSGSPAEVFCVNDIGTDLNDLDEGRLSVEGFLEGELPWRSSFEK